LDVVVVVQFIWRQLSCVLRQLERWAAVPPCLDAQYRATKPHLIFYFNQQKHFEEVKLILQEALLAFNFSKCFGRSFFITAELSDEEDHYSANRSATVANGPASQFYRFFSHFAGISTRYDYVLWVEPDMMPVQHNWLVRLLEQIELHPSDFWIKGPLAKHPGTSHPPLQGNPAIYRIGDPLFHAFLSAVQAAYPNKAYDRAIYDYRTLHKNQWITYETHSQFIYSDFSNDEATYERASSAVREETFFVHLTGSKITRAYCNSSFSEWLLREWYLFFQSNGLVANVTKGESWIFDWKPDGAIRYS